MYGSVLHFNANVVTKRIAEKNKNLYFTFALKEATQREWCLNFFPDDNRINAFLSEVTKILERFWCKVEHFIFWIVLKVSSLPKERLNLQHFLFLSPQQTVQGFISLVSFQKISRGTMKILFLDLLYITNWNWFLHFS